MIAPLGGVACPHCRASLAHDDLASGSQRCRWCGRWFELTRFSPPVRVPRPAALDASGPGGANPCGNHGGNAAETNCGRCGLFLCALCAIEADGRTLCPACFDRLAAAGELRLARTRFRDQSRSALALSWLGLVAFFAGLAIGPAVMLSAQRAERQLKETGEGSRARIVTAFVLGGLETLGGLVFLVYVFRSASQ